MNWFIVILTILAVVFIFVILKFKEFRHKIGFLFILLLLLFFGFSVLQIYKTDADLGSFDGVVSAVKIYFVWLGSIFDNIVGISGYAINQDWGLNKTLTK